MVALAHLGRGFYGFSSPSRIALRFALRMKEKEKEERMIKKISVITAIFIAGFSPKSYSAFCDVNQSISECLKKALAGYCYPTKGSTCSDEECADYNASTSKCKCRTASRIWNSEDRVCEECVAGSFPYNDEKCVKITCPAGTYKVAIVDNKCPAGTYKIAVTSSCPSGAYKYNYTIPTN